MDNWKHTSFNQKPLNSLPSEQVRPSQTPIRPTISTKRRRPKTPLLSCLLIIAIGLIWIATGVLSSSTNSFFSGIRNGFVVRQITHLFDSQANKLRGEDQDRINLLLLGMGGPGHEGPYLSDTIILASVKPSTGEVAMISIPRDLIVPFGDGTYRKVNSVYALNVGQGVDYAFTKIKDIIGKSFGQEIHYMATVDFKGFVEIIDKVGGVTVDVEKSFTDNQFPTADYKTSSVSFEQGIQKMDGLTALRYARSRHGNNGEGSDFARSKRQQKIMTALKDKITSFNTLINPIKITSLFNLLTEYTHTDLEPWEAVKLARLVKDLDTSKIYTQTLDDAPGGYLSGGISSLDGAYILQPRTGNYAELQQMMLNLFKHNDIQTESSFIVLENGTPTAGLALQQVNEINKYGISIDRYGNADKQDYQNTIIYDYTKGKKPETRKILEDYFKTKVKENPPLELLNYTVAKEWNITDDQGNLKNIDFLILIGTDAAQLTANKPIIETVNLLASTTTSTLEILEPEPQQ